MHFKDIPGQRKIKEYFKKFVKENRVPHALLLTGPKGNGKLALALSLANLLLCKNKTDDEACGVCSSCTKSLKYIHPDLHFSYPVIGGLKSKKREDITSKDYLAQWRAFLAEHPFGEMEKWGVFLDAVDKPFNINVKDCNSILSNLSLQSYDGGYKIQIIWGAEYLSKDSNRLLKLIEEPTDKTVIILLCENQNDMLNTILSRCQIVQIPPFTDQDILAHLSQEFNGNEEQLKEVVHLVSGNIDYGKDLISGQNVDFSELLLEWLRACHSSHPEKINAWLNPVLKMGKNTSRSFFKYGLHFFREYIRSIYLDDIKNLRLTEKEKNTVLKMHQLIDATKAEQIIRLFDECIYNISRNANSRLMFLHQSFQIGKILRSEFEPAVYN